MLPVVHQDQAKDLMKLPRPGDLLDRRATVDLKSVDLRFVLGDAPGAAHANCLSQLPKRRHVVDRTGEADCDAETTVLEPFGIDFNRRGAGLFQRGLRERRSPHR